MTNTTDKKAKPDRRVLRTQKSLKYALATLLREKELREISIRELTDLADIHRGTFYAHYQDIYAVLEQIETEIFDGIDKVLVFNPSHDYADLFRLLFNYVEEQIDSFQMLYNSSTGNSFHLKLYDYLYEKTRDIAIADENMTPDNMPARWEYLIRYSTAGFLALLEAWIKGESSYTKEELIQLSIDLDRHIDKLY